MISKLMLLELKTLKQLIKNKSNVDVNKVKDILQLDPTLNVEIITDDTELGKYGEWLLGKLYNKYNQLSEDNKNTIKSDLLFYDYQIRSKRIPQEYDNIYKIKSIEELHEIVNKIQGDSPITQDPVTVAIGNHQFKTVSGNPFELLKKLYYGEIKEDNTTKWLVFNPKTKEESIVAGHGTSWCTARDDEKNLWDDYIYEGNTAWIFLLSSKYKSVNPTKYNILTEYKYDKICIIVERGECKNRPDDQISLRYLPEIGRFIEDRIDAYDIKLENSDIMRFSGDIEYILAGIKNKDNRLNLLFNATRLEKVIDTLPKNEQLFYKKHHPILILNSPNITKEDLLILVSKYSELRIAFNKLLYHNIEIDKDIQLLLVSQYPAWLISLIIKAGIIPHSEVQILLVKKQPQLLLNIMAAGITPDENAQKWLVYNNIDIFENILTSGIIPSKELQIFLVKIKGELIRYIIKYIGKPDKDIQLLLVSRDGYLIEYIINAGIIPDEDVQLLLVNNVGDSIKYLIKANIPVSEDVKLLSVNLSWYLIKYIKNPSELVQLLLISHEHILLKDIENPTPNVQLLLVSKNGFLIIFIKNPTEKIQLLLITQNPDLYTYITNPTPKLTLLYKQLSGITESTGYISKLLDVN